MFPKFMLVRKIINSLIQNDFEFVVCSGCFDIVARKEETLLIKALINVDALKEEHANTLNTISYFCSAYPFVISLKNGRDFLDDDTTYYRFGLPVMTPKLFDRILREDVVVKECLKGKYTVEIDAVLLRKRRKELNYTLQELAEIVHISKKALYEIENKRVKPTFETVEKLERVLGVELKKPFKKKPGRKIYLKPKDEFQAKVNRKLKEIGVDNSPVHTSLFQIVGRIKQPIISCLCGNERHVKEKFELMKRVSNLFLSSFIFITKGEREEGIPTLTLKELESLSSPTDFMQILRERLN